MTKITEERAKWRAAQILRRKGRKLAPEGAERQAQLRQLLDDERFPALMSVVLEFEEDLTESAARYDRTNEERLMDAGGLATIRKLRGVIEDLLTPVAEEPAPPN